VEIAKDAYIISGIKPNDLSLDYVDHEIILVSKLNNGLVLFTGCSHSGILNIIGTVRGMFPNIIIKAIFGGFHLDGLSFEAENATKTKNFIEMIGKQMLVSPILRIYTGHCTGKRPYQILKGVLGSKLEYLANGSTFFVF
jgi:7,8-dihydropterin-6-yl-methyl-4-(beta-D-ribofuranosyl)aminobenzene 5'-phosphate synthase